METVSSLRQQPSPFSVCYEELRRLAIVRLRRLAPGKTLNVTTLVNETCLKLMRSKISDSDWGADRSQFMGIAAEAMRQIIVDYLRKNGCVKRGGDYVRQCIDLEMLPTRMTPERILELNEVIEQMEIEHPSKAQLVKLRFFVGLTMAECAQALEISTPTAERHWKYARAWLADRLMERS